MKKPCLLIVLLAITFSQFKTLKTFAQDVKENYVLSAGQPIKIKRDTFLYKLTPDSYKPKQEKWDYIIIPVTFTNNSNDILKYIGMSCSWWDIYKTDNPQTRILQPDAGCFKNGPIVIKIAPHSSSVVKLTVLFKKELGNSTTFRIGMILQKYVDNRSPIYLPAIEANNMTWTNIIQMP